MSVLQLLHGWSDRDEQPVNYDDDQRFHITPPSSSRHQPRTTSSADNIYRHLPVLHHRHLRFYIYYVRHHLLVHHLRYSFLRITHSDYSHGLLTWITSTLPRTQLYYGGSSSFAETNYNIICHCLTCPWPYSFYELFYLS